MAAFLDCVTGIAVFVVVLIGFLAIVGSFFADFWKEL